MRAYKVVDAFSDIPFKGNPLAVVLDSDGLNDVQMQAIANWTNLSETTFVLPATHPEADYRLRIFTPQSELPFAGHPTLGSAHAILEAGLAVPRSGVMVQECARGLIKLSIQGEGPPRQISFDLPDATITPLVEADIAELEGILGHAIDRRIPPAAVDVGPVWIVVPFAQADTVLQLTPDLGRSAVFEKRTGATGITVFGPYGDGGPAGIEVRSFAPSCGVSEDPVCGSGNGSVAAFQLANSLINRRSTYVATQGRCIGREGHIAIRIDDAGRITVGGRCVTCVDGTLAE